MSGNITPPPGFTLDRAPPPPPGFTLDARTKPAPDDLPWDVPYTGAQMRQAREQIRKGEEEIRALEPEPGLAHLLTGPIRVAQRGGQQALGERPLPTGVEALEEASLGVRPSKFTSAERPSAAAAPRVEPAVPGAPAPPAGFTLDAAPAPAAPKTAPETTGTVNLGGVTMGEAPRPGAPPAEPVPAPAAETETVAVPQADGTVRQVQVKTGEPPPPGEPPAPTTAEAPPTGPVNPADLRAGFPDLSDEQFEALFQQTKREVPRPTTNDPADQQGWMKSVMGVMARLAVPAAAEEQKPTRVTTAQVQARDGVGAVEAGKRAAAENAAQEQQKPTDEWAPVAVAPVDQPDQETPIAHAPGIAAETQPASPEPVNQPEVASPAGSTAQQAPASPEAASPESTPAPIEAHGGPWTPVVNDKGEPAKNHLGEHVYENPNGVRANMDNGVPWTEAAKETDKGLVPKNPGNRKRQHLTTDEPWEAPKPDKTGIKKSGGKADTLAKPSAPADKTDPEKPKADWSLLGKNADGQEVYANPQGVHSTLVDGIRTVEAVRLKPTPQGMAMSVPPPAEKDPQFQVVTPTSESVSESGQIRPENGSLSAEAHPDSTPAEVPIDEPPDELVGALNTLSGGRTHQTPTGEVPPAEEPPEELQGQSTGYKPRREYNKHLTNQAEIAANKLTVDALNGDIPEKNAVAGLGELVRRGGLSEGAARVNLSRLNDWNEGEWAKATSSDSSTTDEAAKPEAPKERYPYNISKYTDSTSIEADRIAVDARNGEMPKEVAVDILAAMTARGDIPEPFAKLMLNKMQVDYDGPLWNNALSGFQARQEAIRTNKPHPPAEAPKAEEPAKAEPMQDDKFTTKERPSLGSTAKDIWDVWRDLRSPGGTFVVDGRGIGGEGTYFWRDGKLHRSFRFTAKSPAWYREATPAEEDEVWDAIEAGAFQITTHGPEGIAQKWSHDMPVQVNHQATGRPLPGTDAEKRLNAAMAEHAAQQRETEEEREVQKKLKQPELAAEKDPVGTIKDFVRATLAGDTGVDAEPAVKALTAYSQTTPLSDHVVNRLSAFLGGEKVPKTVITRINNALGTNPTLDEWTAAVRAERSKSKAPNVESRAVAATHRASVAGDAEAKRLITAAHRARGERDRIRKDYADARNWTASDPQVKQIGGLAISRQRAFGLKHAHEAAVSAVRKADADIAEYGKALSNQAPSDAPK